MNSEPSSEPASTAGPPSAPAPRHVALVTGGSRGIGMAISRRLAAEGAGVVVAARGRQACEQLANEIVAAGGEAWPLALDVTDADSIRNGVAEAKSLAASVGPIDWLVNNAGIAESAPLVGKGGESSDLFDKHLEINFHGARLVTEALLADMKAASYGRIANLASSAGFRGYAYVSAYCASKFALVGYTLAAAVELEGSGVTMNAVCPYYVDSPMLERSIKLLVEKTGRTAREARDFFRDQNPGGELVTGGDVADAVLKLLLGDATGTLVELDGSDRRIVHTPNERARESV